MKRRIFVFFAIVVVLVLVLGLAGCKTKTVAGPQGSKGDTGAAGIGISTAVVDADGNLILTMTDGSTINAGLVKGDQGNTGADGADGIGIEGPAGPQGEQGVGIASMKVSPDGNLIVTLTDGTVINAGYVRGYQGDQGPQGPQGDTGVGIVSIVDNLDGTMTINMTDGSSYTVTLPQGEDGVSVVNVYFRTWYYSWDIWHMSPHHNLMVVLSDGTEIDAGQID
ncbi:MAG: hypothetical protein PHU23_08735 [Dehalococcoidales bacterium]|nr:hypothetical protein [Dehalococcoidales bacterium]